MNIATTCGGAGSVGESRQPLFRSFAGPVRRSIRAA
jgi:hypothetical protein